MIQLSANRRIYISISSVILVSFPPKPFVLLLNECLFLLLFRYRLSPESFGHTLVYAVDQVIIAESED
jgi:hypothetical protein